MRLAAFRFWFVLLYWLRYWRVRLPVIRWLGRPQLQWVNAQVARYRLPSSQAGPLLPEASPVVATTAAPGRPADGARGFNVEFAAVITKPVEGCQAVFIADGAGRRRATIEVCLN